MGHGHDGGNFRVLVANGGEEGRLGSEVFDFGGLGETADQSVVRIWFLGRTWYLVWVSCGRTLCVIPRFLCQTPARVLHCRACRRGRLTEQEQVVGFRERTARQRGPGRVKDGARQTKQR